MNPLPIILVAYATCLLHCKDGRFQQRMNDDSFHLSASGFETCKANCEKRFRANTFLNERELWLTGKDRAGNVRPVSDVAIRCGYLSEGSPKEGKFYASVEPRNNRDSIYLVEVLLAEGNSKGRFNETVLSVEFSFSGMVALHLKEMNKTLYKVRATVITMQGVSLSRDSRWYSSSELFPRKPPILHPVLRSQHLSNRSVTAVFGVEVRGPEIPSCSLTVEWNSCSSPKQISFALEQADSFAINDLGFSRQYSFCLFDSKERAACRAGASNTVEVFTSSCHLLTDDADLCPPPPVSNISWKDVSESKASIFWKYADGALNNSLSHFMIEIRPLSSLRAEECGTFKKTALPHERMVDFEDIKPFCDYKFAVTVIDTSARFSVSATDVKIRSANSFSKWNGLQVALGYICVGLLILWLYCVGMLTWHTSFKKQARNGRNGISEILCFRSAKNSRGRNSATQMKKRARDLRRNGVSWKPNDVFESRNQIYFPYSSGAYSFDDSSAVFSCRFQGHTRQICSSTHSLCAPNTSSSNASRLPLFSAPTSSTSSSVPYLSQSVLPQELVVLSSDTRQSKRSLRCFKSYINTDQVEFVTLNEFVLQDELDRGSFGRVVRASFRGRDVALKIPAHRQEMVPYRKAFIHEAEMCLNLCTSKQDYIVQLLAVVSSNSHFKRLYGLAYECCDGGNLKRFLGLLNEGKEQFAGSASDSLLDKAEGSLVHGDVRQLPMATANALERYAHQIAQALVYISSKFCVHRDIAARNVLLKYPYEDPFRPPIHQHAKLADFGLSVHLDEQGTLQHDRRERLPFRWLPCEYFRTESVYGPEGDVWEYGCLLIEIITFGSNPNVMLPSGNWFRPRQDIATYVNDLTTGILAFDRLFNRTLRPVILKALEPDKKRRISFQAVCQAFERNSSNSELA